MRASAHRAAGRSVLRLVGTLVCSVTFGLTAHAQSYLEEFRLDRFQPAPSLNDGLALELPNTLGHLVPSVQVLGDYAHEPLLTRGFGTDPGDVEIVSSRLNLHVLAALGLGERAEIFVRAPVTAYQTGEAPRAGGRVFREPASAGFGDLALGGSLRLFGANDHGPQLGLHANLLLPTGARDALAGDGGVGAQGSLSFAQVGKHLTVAVQTGLTYRPERQYGFERTGTEWLYRLGLHVPVGERSKLMVELDGASDILDGQFFERDSRPLEALAGARIHLGHGVYGNLGAGLGLLSAPGVPLARGLLGVGYSPAPPPARGTQTEAQATEPEPAAQLIEPAASDLDRDGVPDALDRCKDAPEDFDGFEDDDGCPDEDNDRDGVPDAMDVCPDAAEDMDGDDDEDGCPESDVSHAASPSRPVSEPVAMPVVRDGPAPDHVHFEQDQSGVSGRTRLELRAALEWFRRHPGTYTLVLEGHASAEGSPQYNQDLSLWRAQAAARYLEKHEVWLRRKGVKLKVRAVGKGTSEPVAPNDTEEGRRQNRRVEFRLQRHD